MDTVATRIRDPQLVRGSIVVHSMQWLPLSGMLQRPSDKWCFLLAALNKLYPLVTKGLEFPYVYSNPLAPHG